jgi:hypothetical protein
MGDRDTNKKERFIADSYEPLNILAVNQGDDRVVLSAQDFEKLLRVQGYCVVCVA